MEEILASIRRIISEDDQAPAAEAAPPAPPPAPEPEPPPASTPVHAAPEIEPIEPVYEEEEDVLELNEPAPLPTPAPHSTLGDLDVFPKAEPEPQSQPAFAMAPPPFDDGYDDDDHDGLVSGHVASAAASHFGALSRTIGMPAAGRTLEDVVRELLSPLLKDWLDTYLPEMVEKAVRDEVERISRRRV